MEMREKVFNWLVPARQSGRATMHCDLRFNSKWNTFYLSYVFLVNKMVDLDRTNIRVSFVMEEDSAPLCVINAKEGIPFYRFTPRKDNKSPKSNPACTHQNLADAFRKVFKLEKEGVYEFELQSFEKMNGMMFYKLVECK